MLFIHFVKRTLKTRLLILLCSVFVSIPLLMPHADAATFNVSNTAQLRAALQGAAGNGEDDTIVLAAGTYQTTDDGMGTFTFTDTEAHNLTIKAANGLTGYDVILDGARTHRVFYFTNSQSSTLTLDRISVRNGNVNGSGAGIYVDKNLIVTGCIISGNFATNAGGGIFGTTVTVTNSTISGNVVSSPGKWGFAYGGGIYGTDIRATNSTISGNHAAGGSNAFGYGGGIWGSNVTITNSAISWNFAHNYSGISGSNVTVINSTISQNSSNYGSVIYCAGITSMVNTTISGNSALDPTFEGSFFSGKGTFINNIFNDTPISFTGASYVYNNYIDYTKLYNDIGTVKINNIQPNEGSLNFADSSFRLGAGSVAIDKGLDPRSATFGNLFSDQTILHTVRDALVTDKDGNPRITGAAIDLGAYEFHSQQVVPTTPKTVPTMNEWGMIIFMMFAGLGSVYYMRRQRKET